MSGRLITTLGLLVLVFVSSVACQQDAAIRDQGAIVQIASTKASYFGLPPAYRALHPRLESSLGKAVRFRSQPGGEAIGQQMIHGGVDYAILTAAEYAAIEEPDTLTLVASGINKLGKSSRKAYVVVKARSHVKTIADCKNKRFAFGTHDDLLTDLAVQATLEKAGVPVKELFLEILPPPMAFDGRLYLKDEVPKTIANDVTVNAGVIDEVAYESLPDTGGNFITGPSKNQFEIVGETVVVPEILIVAAPSADPALTQKLKACLLNEVKGDRLICEQLGITGFTEPDKAAYDAVRELVAANEKK